MLSQGPNAQIEVGSLFGSIGHFIAKAEHSVVRRVGKIAKKALPAVLTVAGGAVGTALLPGVGTALGASLGGALGKGAKQVVTSVARKAVRAVVKSAPAIAPAKIKA